jgi:hypothetical protein
MIKGTNAGASKEDLKNTDGVHYYTGMAAVRRPVIFLSNTNKFGVVPKTPETSGYQTLCACYAHMEV